ncbi:MAG: hypothetical protein ACREC5_07010, partial [Thermoplasmata archaeon]
MSNSRTDVVAGGARTRRNSRRLAVALAATAVVAAAVVVVVLSVAPATRSSASIKSPGRSAPAATPPLPTVTPPPPNPDPLSPGTPVGSDQYESDPFLYRSHGRYFLYTSGVPGPPAINVPVASATAFGTWTRSTDALRALPSWAVPGFTWAPDIHQFGS